jgi:hypothetical protein
VDQYTGLKMADVCIAYTDWICMYVCTYVSIYKCIM